MKDRIVMDLGQMMDEIFEATQNFGEAFKHGFSFNKRDQDSPFRWNENVDFYPNHSYPPANVYMKSDRTLVLEFALAGFAEADIDLQFQGDYLVLNAKAPESTADDGDESKEEVRYFKRRLKLKTIEDQKYYAPEDKFDREQVKAAYRNGLLRVTIPSKETVSSKEGVKVDIVADEYQE